MGIHHRTSREGEHGGLPPDVAKTKGCGLTSTQDVAYTNDNTMARLHTETIPTSTLAATARVVDGFVTTQTDHQGITGSFTRAYSALGKVKDIIPSRLRLCGFRCQQGDTGPAGFASESYSCRP